MTEADKNFRIDENRVTYRRDAQGGWVSMYDSAQPNPDYVQVKGITGPGWKAIQEQGQTPSEILEQPAE